MGELIKAAFGTKVTPKLRHYDPNNTDRDYQAEIFCELYPNFPQYKQHVAAFVERNYCTMINDEDHPTPQDVLQFLKPHEVIRLNEWILTRGPNLHQSLGNKFYSEPLAFSPPLEKPHVSLENRRSSYGTFTSFKGKHCFYRVSCSYQEILFLF